MTRPPHNIRPRPGVLEIAPYQGGESAAPGANRVLKLSANENPHGPAPEAVAAYQAAGASLALYPDGGHARLRAAIAKAERIEPERILCGAGSDELIALLCKAYAGEGDTVVHSRHGFLMYAISAKAAGARPVSAQETDLTADVDALLDACDETTRLVFLANPNNPTGSMLPQSEITRLADNLPRQAILVLDAAYAEYVSDPAYECGIAVARARENVVMTRTFSKIHGLAALRLGWLYGPAHVVDALNRVRGPFNVSAPALAAGEAAIGAREHIAREAASNEAWRDWLGGKLAAAGLRVAPSHGNFLLVEFGEHGPANAAAADSWFKSRGLILRRMEGYGLPGWLRISIGDEAACRAVAEAATAFRAARR